MNDLISQLESAKSISESLIYAPGRVSFEITMLRMSGDNSRVKELLRLTQQAIERRKVAFNSEVKKAIERTAANDYRSDTVVTVIRSIAAIRLPILEQIDMDNDFDHDQAGDLGYLWSRLDKSADFTKIDQRMDELASEVTVEMKDRVRFEFNAAIARLESGAHKSSIDTKSAEPSGETAGGETPDLALDKYEKAIYEHCKTGRYFNADIQAELEGKKLPLGSKVLGQKVNRLIEIGLLTRDRAKGGVTAKRPVSDR